MPGSPMTKGFSFGLPREVKFKKMYLLINFICKSNYRTEILFKLKRRRDQELMN